MQEDMAGDVPPGFQCVRLGSYMTMGEIISKISYIVILSFCLCHISQLNCILWPDTYLVKHN